MATRGARTRREYLTIAGVNPADGKPFDVLISYDRVQWLGGISMGHTMECARCVADVLSRPTKVFVGLRREEDQDKDGRGWLCFCGIPNQSYAKDGTELPPRRGRVFPVFVNDRNVAHNWRWEKESRDKPRWPDDYRGRFAKELL